jgi:carbon storage regulator
MLVLTRRAGESLVIDGGITITVMDVRGDSVRVGIDAPREVRVHRSEILAAVEAENRAAVTADESTKDALRALAARTKPADSKQPPRKATR